MPLADQDAYNSYMREYMLARYHTRRAEATRILGGVCAECGVAEELEFDHRNWRDKSFPISKLWSVAYERFLAELEKCQLLCKEHHKEKTRRDMREIKAEKGWANQYGSGPVRAPLV